MSPEKRAQQIERAALSAAQKALKGRPGETLSRDELLSLRVQTAPFWLRALLVVLGSAMLLAGILAIVTLESGAPGFFLAAAGFILICVGLVGWRRTLANTLDSLSSDLAELVIEAIVAALD